MKERLTAILRLAVAIFLYPLALAALIWIAWTGRSAWMGVLVLGSILLIDRTWWIIIKSVVSNTKKRPRQ